MKRTITYLALFIVISLLAASCQKEEESFDSSLLIGKWQSGTLYYKYLSGGSGATWDTADDVSEAEAQTFTWTLVGSELTQNHKLDMGGTVPKVYTVTELTATTLKYRDSFYIKSSFTKVGK